MSNSALAFSIGQTREQFVKAWTMHVSELARLVIQADVSGVDSTLPSCFDMVYGNYRRINQLSSEMIEAIAGQLYGKAE